MDTRPLEQSWDTTLFGTTKPSSLVATSSTLATPHFEFDPLHDGEDMEVDVTAMVHEFNVFDSMSRLPTAAHAGNLNSLVMQLNLEEDAQSVAQVRCSSLQTFALCLAPSITCV